MDIIKFCIDNGIPIYIASNLTQVGISYSCCLRDLTYYSSSVELRVPVYVGGCKTKEKVLKKLTKLINKNFQYLKLKSGSKYQPRLLRPYLELDGSCYPIKYTNKSLAVYNLMGI